MGNITCFEQSDFIQYTVLLIGPSGSGKTRLISQQATGPTIKLERHLIKVNQTSQLNFIDTPGIMNLFKNVITPELLMQVDVIAYFNDSDPYRDYINSIISQNSKLSKSVPFYNIPDSLDHQAVLDKILLFIVSHGRRKSKKPSSYLQEAK